jgi:predicted O-methyltransferase YrrM
MSALVASWTRAHRGEPCSILEIGSWTGGSAITWAKALDEMGAEGKVVCIDKWEVNFEAAGNVADVYKEMTRAASSGEAEKLFWHNIRAAGVEPWIVLLRGLTQEVLPLLEPRYFSIVFVDGSHNYQDVLHDIRYATDLVRDGGVVCGDDLEVQRHDCSEKVLQRGIALNTDYLVDERTGQWYHPGVTAAVGELLGPVSVWEGFWAVERRDNTWHHVELTDVREELPIHLRSSDVEAVLVAEGLGGYNIVQSDDAYIGIPSTLGPLRIDDESSLAAAMGATIIGTSLEVVKEQIAHRRLVEPATDQVPSSPAPTAVPVLVVEGYKGFNLLAYRGRYYALSQRLGPVRLDGPDFDTFVPLGLAAVSDSEVNTRRIVDEIADRAGQGAGNSRLATDVGRGLDPALQSLLEALIREVGGVTSAVTTMTAALGATAASIATHEHELTRLSLLEQELTERQTALNQAIESRDRVMAELASAVAKHERLTKEMTSTAAERDRVIAAHSGCGQTLSNRTKELVAAQQQISKLTAEQTVAREQREADARKLNAALQRIRELKRRVKAGEDARHVLEAEGQELLAWVQRLQHEFVSGERS